MGVNDNAPADIPADGLWRKVDREQGYKKAAAFLLLLEKNRAARVLSQLSEEEVEGIVREIANLKNLDPAQAKKIRAEFGLPAAGREDAKGRETERAGLEAAEGILKAAFGEKRAAEIIAKVQERAAPGYFSFLKEIDREQLQGLLKDESAQVIALVLAQLDPATASHIMEALDGERQKEVAKRIAQMDKVLPEVIRRTADTLKKKLFQQADFSTLYIDGKSALRNILKHMDYGRERAILDTLSEEKPDLAIQLEKELFTMETFRKMTRKDRQAFLRSIGDRDLAMSLKGESPEMKDLIFDAVSERRKAYILEESNALGEVPREEAEKARQVVLEALKMKIGAGEIILLDEDEGVIEGGFFRK